MPVVNPLSSCSYPRKRP